MNLSDRSFRSSYFCSEQYPQCAQDAMTEEYFAERNYSQYWPYVCLNPPPVPVHEWKGILEALGPRYSGITGFHYTQPSEPKQIR